MPRYNPAVIEPKWQKYWDENRTFKTPEMPTGPKLYVLDMFPYPSGAGLHVGHPEGYTATDIVCRFERMRGKSVLHPMGFDAFGLPAEEHAIKTGKHPRGNTEENIANFRRQLKMLGFSYDWDRELATTDVDYFRWTQWIFLELFDTWFDSAMQKGRPISELPIPPEIKSLGERAVRLYQDENRLAYQSDALVNWCPALGTVLANEEVIDGKSERGNHPVVRMPLRQWMLRITAYADRLEKDLETVDWPEGVKKLQRDWVGRSVGAEVDFYIGDANSTATANSPAFAAWKKERATASFPRKPGDDVLRIYTTRPDTLFGVTYMVIAPEHPFVERLTTEAQRTAVKTYCEKAASKSDRDRQDVAKKKTGVFSGSYALNPVNGQPVPVWIADYVLWGYGTGAIMAVPAHDERDFAFAKQFGIEIIPVVASEKAEDAPDFEKEGFFEYGIAVNSDEYNGLPTLEFKARIGADLTRDGLGREAVNYKLRDWLFCRQRFWGEPFPILHELDENGQPNGLIRAVDAKDLPVDLPHLDDFKPHGRPEPPLGKAPEQWLYPVIDGKRYRRETNTMPQWAGSCWYYLRYIDNRNENAFVDPAKEKAWMSVDLYVGGAEHAVLHLLYSRFWHKVLFDRGLVSSVEPFHKLINQGLILGETEYQISAENYSVWKDRIAELGYSVLVLNSDDENVYILKSGGSDPKTQVNLTDDQVEKRKGKTYLKGTELDLNGKAEKMSKSRGNVVSPDEVVTNFGADSLRLYEMFMGPLEATKPWSMQGVGGVRGFLDRTWRMITEEKSEILELNPSVQDVAPTDEQNRMLHKTIKVITGDVAAISLNTAIARMMEFVNFFTKEAVRPKKVMEQFVLLLSPYAPHIAEELWQLLGHTKTLAYEPWPTFDEKLTVDDTIEVPVQIGGKVRAKISVPAAATQAELEAAAKAEPKIAELLVGKQIVKAVIVPGRLVNFVIK